MYKTEVMLLFPTRLDATRAIYRTALAASTCTMTEERISLNDYTANVALVKKLVANGHGSVLEHIVYTFQIQNITRALLQELSRHRMTSPTVQSTRWALKKMESGESSDIENVVYVPEELNEEDRERYIKVTKDMLELRKDLSTRYPNDVAKYATPESMYTKEMLTVNCRSLMNIFELRSSKRALPEFRYLVFNMYLALPCSHLFLYDDVVPEDWRKAVGRS